MNLSRIKTKWNKTARKVGQITAKKIFREEGNIIASTCPLAGLHLNDINDEKKFTSDKKTEIFHPIELIAKSYGDYYDK